MVGIFNIFHNIWAFQFLNKGKQKEEIIILELIEEHIYISAANGFQVCCKILLCIQFYSRQNNWIIFNNLYFFYSSCNFTKDYVSVACKLSEFILILGISTYSLIIFVYIWTNLCANRLISIYLPKQKNTTILQLKFTF